MGARSPDFGFYLPDREELLGIERSLHQLTRAAFETQEGRWTPEQHRDVDKLTGFLAQWGPWAKPPAAVVTEQHERLAPHVAAGERLDVLAKLRASFAHYQTKRKIYDEKKGLGLLGDTFAEQLGKCEPIRAAIAAPAASPRPALRVPEPGAPRRTTQNRPRSKPDRKWTEKKQLDKAARRLGLEAGPQVLLAELIELADASGASWPSKAKLAAELKVSKSTMSRHLRKLEACGLVTVDNFRRRNGRQGACTYRLRLDALATAHGLDHVTRGDTLETLDHVTRGDTLDGVAAAASTPTPKTAPQPNVTRGVKLTPPEQKSLIKEPGLIGEREAPQASPSPFNGNGLYDAARERATAAFEAQAARQAALAAAEIAEPSLPEELAGLVTAQKLIQELVGSGQLVAAQALRDNQPGVVACAVVAQDAAKVNPAGYLLVMLRNGKHLQILEEQEQERSEEGPAGPHRHLKAVV